MSSNTIRIIAVCLLVLAGLLALLAWQVSRQSTPVVQPQGTVALHPVVVTTRPVEAGKPIAADAVRIAQLPLDPGGAYRDTTRVVGQVPLVSLGANVPVLESQLLAGLARQVPDGERAVAVAVDEVIGVGHQVQPGDYVDVFVVMRRDSQEIAESQARMLLSRLRVLAYGHGAVNEAPPQEAEQLMTRRDGAKTAVLSVPLAAISQLALAQQAGRLMLALRNPKDPEMPSEGMFAEPAGVLKARAGVPAEAQHAPADRAVAGVALAGMIGAPPAAARNVGPVAAPITQPAPAAAPARREPATTARTSGVEVIRAGKRDTE
ncbi:Flp pilus assembly protein CpaB [Cupriavidus plantarum]|uniref:Flp pilus assembly protein CpaB n=1 Tax=Cupriavidus plantarum TaxID=942865 RepID=UPI00339DA477